MSPSVGGPRWAPGFPATAERMGAWGPSRPPVKLKLITAHRILIGAGIALFVFYGAIQLRQYLASGAGGPLAQAVVSVTVAVGFVLYYRSLRRRWDKPS